MRPLGWRVPMADMSVRSRGRSLRRWCRLWCRNRNRDRDRDGSGRGRRRDGRSQRWKSRGCARRDFCAGRCRRCRCRRHRCRRHRRWRCDELGRHDLALAIDGDDSGRLVEHDLVGALIGVGGGPPQRRCDSEHRGRRESRGEDLADRGLTFRRQSRPSFRSERCETRVVISRHRRRDPRVRRRVLRDRRHRVLRRHRHDVDPLNHWQVVG